MNDDRPVITSSAPASPQAQALVRGGWVTYIGPIWVDPADAGPCFVEGQVTYAEPQVSEARNEPTSTHLAQMSDEARACHRPLRMDETPQVGTDTESLDPPSLTPLPSSSLAQASACAAAGES